MLDLPTLLEEEEEERDETCATISVRKWRATRLWGSTTTKHPHM